MPIRETERQRTERVLQDLLAEAQAAQNGVEESRRFLLSGLFSKMPGKKVQGRETPRPPIPLPGQGWPQPPQAQFPKPNSRSDRRSDLVVASLGVTLGLICALFPWYIFYNDVRFTTHGFQLGGNGERTGRIVTPNPAAGSLPPMIETDASPQNLDPFATGTADDSREDPSKAPGIDQQPFPVVSDFQLVHVANGRAMIEDDTGLWIVQPGSTLPDNSKVASIERRDGGWVLVTSTDAVIELAR